MPGEVGVTPAVQIARRGETAMKADEPEKKARWVDVGGGNGGGLLAAAAGAGC